MTMMDWGNLGAPHRGDGDQIVYYRRPLKNRHGREAENAGWITWGDSLSGTKLRDYLRRGFEPLMKYGVINSPEAIGKVYGTKDRPPERGWTTARYIWEPILTHPDGPSEFPLEQIMAYRWYRPEECPVPDVIWPQLVGKKVREFRCPERCGRAPFVEVDGVGGIGALATHLRVIHEWDRTALIAYGDRYGIDFNAPDVGGDFIEEFTPADVTEKPIRRQRVQPQVELETVG